MARAELESIFADIVQHCRDTATILTALSERGVAPETGNVLLRIKDDVQQVRTRIDVMINDPGCGEDLSSALELREQVAAIALEAASMWRPVSD